jgi:hypothetical protein
VTKPKTKYRKTPLKASGDPVRLEHATELIPGVEKAIAKGKATPASGLLSLRLIQAFGLSNALSGQLRGKGRPKGKCDDKLRVDAAIKLIEETGITANKAATIGADRWPDLCTRASLIHRIAGKVREEMKKSDK